MAISKNRVEEEDESELSAKLLEARRQKRDADEKLQAMLNRISFLKSEELKMDRDIENARKRTRDLLARKAEKAEKLNDEDVLSTTKDILGSLGPSTAANKPLRQTNGRSSLNSSIASSLRSVAVQIAAPASCPPPLSGTPPAAALQRLPSSGLPLRPSLSSSLLPVPPAVSVKRTRSSSSPVEGAARKPPSGSAGSSQSPTEANRKKAAASTRSSTNVATASGSVASAGPPAPRAHGQDRPPSLSGSAGRPPSPPATAETATVSSVVDVVPCQPRTAAGGSNKMDMLSGRRDEVDQGLIEELIAGSSEQSGTHLQGLQQFSSEAASKVVHVRAARKQGEAGSGSAAVLAAGVGWGLRPSSASAPEAAPILPLDKAESKQMQLELTKKRQLRTVRKAFGLQPTPLHDSSAQVVEMGAGAWQ